MNEMSFGVSMSNNFQVGVETTAHAYRNEMQKIIEVYMKQAIKSDRTTVYNAIKDAGQLTLAEYIRKM